MNQADFRLKASAIAPLHEVRSSRTAPSPLKPVVESNGSYRRRLTPHPTVWQFVVARDGTVLEASEPYLATSTVTVHDNTNGFSIGLPSLDEQLRLMLVAAFDGRPQQELMESARGSLCRLLVKMCADAGLVRVEILDLNASLGFPSSLFAELFGLTATECLIVNALLHGDTLREYAEKNGVSRNTARTHLKSVFMKTRTHRQADLVRMAQLLCVSHNQTHCGSTT